MRILNLKSYIQILTVSVLILFFLQNIVIASGNKDLKQEGIVKITSYFQISINEKGTYKKSEQNGFIFGSQGYIITSFKGVKGAEYLTADYGDSNSKTFIFSTDNLALSTYFIDEQRDIIIFSLNNSRPFGNIILTENPEHISSLLFIKSGDETIEYNISEILNVYKAIYYLLDNKNNDDILPGSPVFSNKGYCAGMVVYNDGRNIYVISSEQIRNSILQLSDVKNPFGLKPQIDDYIISTESISKLKDCTDIEIKQLKIYKNEENINHTNSVNRNSAKPRIFSE